MAGPTYICNACNRQIAFSNTYEENESMCMINVKKQTDEGIVQAACGMRYQRIIKDAPTKDEPNTRRYRSLAKKAG